MICAHCKKEIEGAQITNLAVDGLPINGTFCTDCIDNVVINAFNERKIESYRIEVS